MLKFFIMVSKLTYLLASGLVTLGLNLPAEAEENNLETAVSASQTTKASQITGAQEKLEQKVSEQTISDVNVVLIRNFLEDYLDNVTPQSSTFKKLRKKYGREGVLEKYSQAHLLCLDLAVKYAHSNKEIPEDEKTKLGEDLADSQAKTSKGISSIDYSDTDVKTAFSVWGICKVDNFQKLLEAADKVKGFKIETLEDAEEYVKELHHAAYTRESFQAYIDAQNTANGNLYDAMDNTLSGFASFFGGGEFGRIRKCTYESYDALVNRFFPEAEKK